MVTDEERALTVIVRHAQWVLDDLANDLPAGRVTVERRREVANALADMARMLRESADRLSIGEAGQAAIIDPEQPPPGD